MTEEVADKAKSVKATTKQQSYFNTVKLNRFMLGDGISYIEHTFLDEGIFEAYQDLTSAIKLDQTGQTTEVDMALGKTRRFLLENLVTGWNLVDDNGDPIPFSPKKLRELPPHIIGQLIQDIYDKNPILGGEVSEPGKDSNTK